MKLPAFLERYHTYLYVMNEGDAAKLASQLFEAVQENQHLLAEPQYLEAVKEAIHSKDVRISARAHTFTGRTTAYYSDPPSAILENVKEVDGEPTQPVKVASSAPLPALDRSVLRVFHELDSFTISKNNSPNEATAIGNLLERLGDVPEEEAGNTRRILLQELVAFLRRTDSHNKFVKGIDLLERISERKLADVGAFKYNPLTPDEIFPFTSGQKGFILSPYSSGSVLKKTTQGTPAKQPEPEKQKNVKGPSFGWRTALSLFKSNKSPKKPHKQLPRAKPEPHQ